MLIVYAFNFMENIFSFKKKVIKRINDNITKLDTGIGELNIEIDELGKKQVVEINLIDIYNNNNNKSKLAIKQHCLSNSTTQILLWTESKNKFELLCKKSDGEFMKDIYNFVYRLFVEFSPKDTTLYYQAISFGNILIQELDSHLQETELGLWKTYRDEMFIELHIVECAWNRKNGNMDLLYIRNYVDD